MTTVTKGGSVRTVLVCMMANNFTLGLMFGSFGALLALNEQAFGEARDTISLGMSAFTTMMGLSALFMGGLVQKFTPRLALALGVSACCCAFLVLSLTSNLVVAFAMWGLLGFGTAMAAILAPVAIAAEHFPDRSGRILGLVNLPVVLFVAPWAITKLVPILGRDGVYLLMAGLLAPVLLLALSLPSTRSGLTDAHRHSAGGMPARLMMARSDFWLITLGIALIAGTGVAFTVHAIPYAETRGLPKPNAALMLSLYSGAGLAGVPLFGWLADKLGPPTALAISAALQSLCWFGLAISSPANFFVIAAVLGLATTPLTTLHGAAMAGLFGAASVSKAMGISFAVKLPFLFAISPAVAYAFVHLNDYRPAILTVSASLLGAFLILVAGLLAARGRAFQPDNTPLAGSPAHGPA
ncbi:MAG: MFS transporter [Sphingomonadales bacterium]|nr:MAG: MFS transporter [Sphingomonadales bacterium]